MLLCEVDECETRFYPYKDEQVRSLPGIYSCLEICSGNHALPQAYYLV